MEVSVGPAVAPYSPWVWIFVSLLCGLRDFGGDEGISKALRARLMKHRHHVLRASSSAGWGSVNFLLPAYRPRLVVFLLRTERHGSLSPSLTLLSRAWCDAGQHIVDKVWKLKGCQLAACGPHF